MDELDSGSQLIYNGLEFYFAQVVGYRGPAQIKINGVQFDVYGYQKWRTDKDHPWSRLEIIPNGGWCSVIVGQWFEDVEVQQQGGAGQAGANTAANELESGPLAVAAGANPTQIIAPNNGRARGVSVQNVGGTVIAVSRLPALRQDLTAAGIQLAPGAAANDGNGDVATFVGWQGGLWAVNVAGGPGTVLVSAF